MLKIVTIGGGTGLYTLLKGLKKYPLDLFAVVAVTDDGGSNKKFRDEFGLLPPSDFRQCLVALSNEPENSSLRHLMMYRFSKGLGLERQTLGNILIAALTDIEGSQQKAMEKLGKLLNIQGLIIPITTDNAHLMAKYANGEVVLGEHLIDEPEEFHDSRQSINRLFLNRKTIIYPRAKRIIAQADYIILGPGDLYTSTLANIAVGGAAATIRKSNAKIIYIINLMTKYGQTYGFTAKKHVKEIKKYLGKNPDYILINKRKLPKNILKKYASEKHDFPVRDDLKPDGYKIVRTDLISYDKVRKQKGDNLYRSLIRHDPDKLARVIWRIVDAEKK